MIWKYYKSQFNSMFFLLVNKWAKLSLHWSTSLPASRQLGSLTIEYFSQFATYENGVSEHRTNSFYAKRAKTRSRQHLVSGRVVCATEETRGRIKIILIRINNFTYSLILQDTRSAVDVSRYVLNSIMLLLTKSGPENVKCVCQSLKVNNVNVTLELILKWLF